MKIKALLPALITNKEQEKMTDLCRKSLVSFDHCLKIEEDQKPYKAKVAGVWNNFLDKWRGKDYDYLLITANDTQADPKAIDWMVKCAENTGAGMVTGKVTRDLKEFKKGFGQQEWTEDLTMGLIDPACFLLKRGVIEKVGRIDEYFPAEFVERDYIYRMKLAGYDVVQPDMVLWYHPPHSGTIGNPPERLQKALRRYVSKWGGDANREQYRHPFNDFNLTYKHCKK